MSDFLFSSPSALEGAARVIDLFGTIQMYNSSETPDQADKLAFSMDIASLKSDFRASSVSLVHKHGKKSED